MAEVEAQPVGGDERAGLLDVLAQHPAQGRVQQMGGRVIESRRLACSGVHDERHRVPLAQTAGGHAALMDDDAGRVLDGGVDPHLAPGADDAADVADLAAGLGVEGRALGDQVELAARPDLRRFALPLHEEHRTRLGRQQVVAHKLRFEAARGQALVSVRDAREARHGAGLGALPLHLALEPVHIEGHAPVTHHVAHDVHREPVSVVELEDRSPRHLGPASGLELSEGLVQELQARVERVQKAHFLVADDVGNERVGFGQLGIGRLHDAEHDLGRVVQEGLGEADVAAVPDGPAHDAPQHVAAALVRGQDAVADQEDRRAAVVRDDLHGDVGSRRPAEADAGQLLGARDDRADQVGVVVGVHPLDHRNDPLQPHAGVDARLGKPRHRTRGVAVELHEHEVPDLEVPVALAAHGALGCPHP